MEPYANLVDYHNDFAGQIINTEEHMLYIFTKMSDMGEQGHKPDK